MKDVHGHKKENQVLGMGSTGSQKQTEQNYFCKLKPIQGMN